MSNINWSAQAHLCVVCFGFCSIQKKTLHQAVKSYSAQSEEELSFVEGTFVKELSDVSVVLDLRLQCNVDHQDNLVAC